MQRIGEEEFLQQKILSKIGEDSGKLIFQYFSGSFIQKKFPRQTFFTKILAKIINHSQKNLFRNSGQQTVSSSFFSNFEASLLLKILI